MPNDGAVNPEAIEMVRKNLYAIGSAAHSVRLLAGTLIAHCASDAEGAAMCEGIEALVEKAGYLADKNLALLGVSAGVCGGYDGWLNADTVPEVSATAL